MLSDDTSSSVLAKLGNLESVSAVDRVNYAFKAFRGQLVLSTSFGIQSAVMLHLVSSQIPNIPVVFIDTGYLFPETYRFAQLLTERLELNLKTYRPLQTAAQQEALYGKLWESGLQGLEQYNKINKIEPMNRAIRELGAVHGYLVFAKISPLVVVNLKHQKNNKKPIRFTLFLIGVIVKYIITYRKMLYPTIRCGKKVMCRLETGTAQVN